MNVLMFIGALGGAVAGHQMCDHTARLWSLEALKEYGVMVGCCLFGMALGAGVGRVLVSVGLLEGLGFAAVAYLVSRGIRNR